MNLTYTISCEKSFYDMAIDPKLAFLIFRYSSDGGVGNASLEGASSPNSGSGPVVLQH